MQPKQSSSKQSSEVERLEFVDDHRERCFPLVDAPQHTLLLF